jgi:hypothetical protein
MSGPGAKPGQTDEELATENVGGEHVAEISIVAWSRVRLAGLEHVVLVAAERAGLPAVRDLFRTVGAELPAC